PVIRMSARLGKGTVKRMTRPGWRAVMANLPAGDKCSTTLSRRHGGLIMAALEIPAIREEENGCDAIGDVGPCRAGGAGDDAGGNAGRGADLAGMQRQVSGGQERRHARRPKLGRVPQGAVRRG